MQKIYVFDFDGTVTRHDTLLLFIRFARGRVRLWLGLLLFSPLLVLMKLRLIDNGRVKERLFSHFFRGMSQPRFNQTCLRFGQKHFTTVRPSALKIMEEANDDRHRVVVVSASVENWVRALLDQYDVNAEVIGTQVEEEHGLLTGRFSTPNCYGAEKVRRLEAVQPDRADCFIVAYGDSRGDKELLDYADESHYRELD